MNLLRFKNINLIFILLLCLSTNLLQGQQKFTDNLSIVSNYHFGLIIPEYQFINYFTNDYVRSVDLSLVKQTTGKTYWDQLFKYPQYGLSLFYSTLGNNDVFGKELSLNYFFKTNLINNKQFHLFNQIGAGLSYVNKTFDLENNPNNVAIGSNFDVHFNFRLGINYTLAQKSSFNLGLSFDHLSNANTNEFNYGLNYLTAFGGISYRIGDQTELHTHNIETHQQKNNLKFCASIGGKHTDALISDYYLTSSFEFEFQRELTPVFHLGVGLDLFYDSSVEEQFSDIGQKFKNSDSFQSGIHISESFTYNKFCLTIQEGLYVLLPNKIINKKMYNRAVLQYEVTNHMFVRIAMKSHVFILDFPELGVGFKL